ncbi:arylamine N-acetyltransferase [candidate division KSB1 bacterium]|nr:arylamine N-acetyltransferase [candidate division KSB1 bacterium]
MNIEAYLQRLNYDGPRTRTIATLRALHQAHLLAVPFENLDIPLGRPIVLEERALYDKIVRQRRGGFCYELNGLFAALLRVLGFEVKLLSGGVMDNGEFGPEFDHLTLLVQLDEERWLADVGFGDSFREPLRLDERNEQLQQGIAYRLSNSGEHWNMLRRLPEQEWGPQYHFTLQPHRLADFAGMCRYHQTSPASHFMQKRICSRATPEGRVTLSDMRLIITANGQRQEMMLRDQEECSRALKEHFGIDLTRSKSYQR